MWPNNKILQGLNALDNLLLLSWTDCLGTIKNIAHRLTEHRAVDGTDAAGAVLVQKSIATDGHFHFRALDKIDRRIELLELVQPLKAASDGESKLYEMTANKMNTKKHITNRYYALTSPGPVHSFSAPRPQ